MLTMTGTSGLMLSKPRHHELMHPSHDDGLFKDCDIACDIACFEFASCSMHYRTFGLSIILITTLALYDELHLYIGSL